MPSPPDRARQLRDRRARLRTDLAQVGDLRPGSLVERYRRCGKANCHCAHKGAVGHGPSWSLTREVAGKTVTTIIPAGAVEQTRQQLVEYKRFRRLGQELVETSEHLCDALLAPEAASQEAAQKGGSKRRAPTRSSPRSRRW